VWELMKSESFQEVLEQHQLPRCRSRRERQALLASLPQRRQALTQLAQGLGVALQGAPTG